MRELYRRYAKNLYRFGLHMLGDGGLAEEMVQESFQRLWRSAGRFDARRGSVGAFLFVIARSAAADIRKRPSSRLLLPVEDFQLPRCQTAPIRSSIPSSCAKPWQLTLLPLGLAAGAPFMLAYDRYLTTIRKRSTARA